MSDVWQGPGWWIASDGRWYPPELHPLVRSHVPPPQPWWGTAEPGAVPVAGPAGGAERSGGRGKRPMVAGAVALAAVALGATVLALSVPSPSPVPVKANATGPRYIAPLTGFAGYHWLGNVDQISAQWQVPVIAATTSVGHASTWIGAQNDDGGPPFIQVGVTEDRFGPGLTDYEGFWSDTAASFHPQPLGAVEPGDLISASMVRQSQGWSVTLDDRTSTVSTTKLIAYGVGGSFTAGEWIQEDPTDSAEAAVDLPYPETSTVTFEQLRVNGRPPLLDLADGQTLSAADGIILVPSAVRHDGFALTAPTGVAAQYLGDAARLDAALSKYRVELASWGSTPLATRTLDVQNLSAAYQTNASELAAQPWPAAAHPDVSLLTDQLRRVVSDLQVWTASGLETDGTAFATLRSDQQIAPVADQVRADLGLPPA